MRVSRARVRGSRLLPKCSKARISHCEEWIGDVPVDGCYGLCGWADVPDDDCVRCTAWTWSCGNAHRARIDEIRKEIRT